MYKWGGQNDVYFSLSLSLPQNNKNKLKKNQPLWTSVLPAVKWYNNVYLRVALGWLNYISVLQCPARAWGTVSFQDMIVESKLTKVKLKIGSLPFFRLNWDIDLQKWRAMTEEGDQSLLGNVVRFWHSDHRMLTLSRVKELSPDFFLKLISWSVISSHFTSGHSET